MLEQHVLHHAGIDVLAAGHDHVLDAVLDVDIAFVVEDAGVAGVQPAAAEGLRRLVGQVPVAAHELRAPDDDLADGAVGHRVVVLIHNANLGADERSPG